MATCPPPPPVSRRRPATPATPSRRPRPAAARRSRKGLVGGILAVIILIAGAAVTYAVVNKNETASGGGGSPEAATRNMVESLEANDLLGALDTLAPSERQVVRDQIDQWLAEGKRLGALKDVDLKDVPGFQPQINDLTLETEPVNDRVAAVTFTGGTYTV